MVYIHVSRVMYIHLLTRHNGLSGVGGVQIRLRRNIEAVETALRNGRREPVMSVPKRKSAAPELLERDDCLYFFRRTQDRGFVGKF